MIKYYFNQRWFNKTIFPFIPHLWPSRVSVLMVIKINISYCISSYWIVCLAYMGWVFKEKKGHWARYVYKHSPVNSAYCAFKKNTWRYLVWRYYTVSSSTYWWIFLNKNDSWYLNVQLERFTNSGDTSLLYKHSLKPLNNSCFMLSSCCITFKESQRSPESNVFPMWTPRFINNKC